MLVNRYFASMSCCLGLAMVRAEISCLGPRELHLCVREMVVFLAQSLSLLFSGDVITDKWLRSLEIQFSQMYMKYVLLACLRCARSCTAGWPVTLWVGIA